MSSTLRARGPAGHRFRRLLAVGVLLLAVVLVFGGSVALSEWAASRVWRRCRTANGMRAEHVQRHLREIGIVVPVRCRPEPHRLNCRWRTLLGNRYQCEYEIDGGRATLIEGSG